MVRNEWKLGTKIVVVDPQGEYKEVTMSFYGNLIDIVDGRINPFHIHNKKKIEEVKFNG